MQLAQGLGRSNGGAHAFVYPSPLIKQEIRQCSEIFRARDTFSWHPARGGSFSLRDRQGISWLCPHGGTKSELHPADFIAINYNKMRPVGPFYSRLSEDLPIHCAIFRGDPDARIVMHTHAHFINRQKRSSLEFSQNELIKSFGLHTHDTTVHIPVFPNTQDFQGFAASLMDQVDVRLKVFVLLGHGAYAWGRTIEETVFRLDALEFLCRLNP